MIGIGFGVIIKIISHNYMSCMHAYQGW